MQDQIEIQKLKKLTNTELFERAKLEVKEETNATLKVLYVLREIEKRRAFAEKSYPSLFEFCTEFLGYKKDAAYRRVAAMRVLKDLPELEDKIRGGSLKLTTLSQAQTYFNQKKRKQTPLAKEQKLELLNSLEGQSTRDADKFFLELMPKEHPQEKLIELDSETYGLTLAWPKVVHHKMQKLKTLMGAEKAKGDTIGVIDRALDLAIEYYQLKYERCGTKLVESEFTKSELAKVEFAEPNESEVTESSSEKSIILESNYQVQVEHDGGNENQEFRAPGKSENPSRYIPINIRRMVWQRDNGQCSYVDEQKKQRCSSRYRLEMDHIQAIALGGSNEIENLRLLCRAHNQRWAIQNFGLNKVSNFIN